MPFSSLQETEEALSTRFLLQLYTYTADQQRLGSLEKNTKLMERFQKSIQNWVQRTAQGSHQILPLASPSVVLALARVDLPTAITFVQSNHLQNHPSIHHAIGGFLREKRNLKGYMLWEEAFPGKISSNAVLKACLRQLIFYGKKSEQEEWLHWLNTRSPLPEKKRNAIKQWTQDTQQQEGSSPSPIIEEQSFSLERTLSSFQNAPLMVKEHILNKEYTQARQLILKLHPQHIHFHGAQGMINETLVLEAGERLLSHPHKEVKQWLKTQHGRYSDHALSLPRLIELSFIACIERLLEENRLEEAIEILNQEQLGRHTAVVAHVAGHILRVGASLPSDGIIPPLRP